MGNQQQIDDQNQIAINPIPIAILNDPYLLEGYFRRLRCCFLYLQYDKKNKMEVKEVLMRKKFQSTNMIILQHSKHMQLNCVGKKSLGYLQQLKSTNQFQRKQYFEKRIYYQKQEECSETEWIFKIKSEYMDDCQKSLIIDEFKCGICLLILNQPLMLQCNHLFCCHCISKMAISNKQRKCPLCKQDYILLELDPYSSLSASISKIIQSLTVSCYECSLQEIKWMYQYEKLPLHQWKHQQNKAEECDQCNKKVLQIVAKEHKDLFCENLKKNCNLCQKEVLKKNLLSHIGKECSSAFTQCRICDSRYPKSDEKKHQVKCKQMYGSNIARDCQFKYLGCQSHATPSRQRQQEHLSQCEYNFESCSQCFVILMRKDLLRHNCIIDEYDYLSKEMYKFDGQKQFYQLDCESELLKMFRHKELFGIFAAVYTEQSNLLEFEIKSYFIATNIKLAFDKKMFQDQLIEVKINQLQQ